MRVPVPFKRLFRFLPASLKWTTNLIQKRPWLFVSLAVVVVALGTLLRLWASPISAGPDIGQFWGFAKLFQLHGLDFYRFADGYDPLLAVPGWGFVYPPIWLFILRVALMASPASLATSDMIDVSWRVAEKLPIIAADIGIALLLLWAIPGSRLKKLTFASLWLIHPTSWYNSAIFGQFDAIAAALLLASLVMFVKNWDRPAFILAALAALTKQHAALPALFMIVAFSRKIPFRRLVENCAIMLGIATAVSLPFVLGGNLLNYLKAVLFPAQQPGYQNPLVYAFSGGGAIITYLHDKMGWNIEYLISLSTPVFIGATLAALAIVYFKRIKVEQAALIGILLFVGIFYRINYQYLVIYIPLAIYVLAVSSHWAERSLSLALVIIPAAWVWIFDMSFWFWYFTPRTVEVPSILATLGLTHYVGDIYYVVLASVLMAACLSYVIWVLSSRQPSSVVPETPGISNN